MTGSGRHGAGAAGGPAQEGLGSGQNEQQRKPGELLGAYVPGVGGLGHSCDCRGAERKMDLGHLLEAGPDLLLD